MNGAAGRPRSRALGLGLLLALALASSSRAMPSARIAWREAESAPSPRSLLLVLERVEGAWSLRDARVAAVPAKALPHDPAAASGPLFVLEDRDGRPLLAGRLRVEERRHGPAIDPRGLVRCVAVPADDVAVPLRLPLVAAPGALRLLAPSSWSPESGEPLAAALRARSSDAGFEPLAVFDLGHLPFEASP